MIKKTRTKILLGLVVLASSFAALAPTASATFEFEPGSVFAKTHAPLNQEPPGYYEFFNGIFSGGSAVEEWVQSIADAPELTQAGGHPDFTTSFAWTQAPGHPLAGGHPKTIVIDAPAGAVGNPRAVPRCSAAEFHLALTGACRPDSQVGEAITALSGLAFLSPVSSLVPTPGVPATLGYKSLFVTVVVDPEVRSDGDYGLRIKVDDITIPIFDFTGSTVTLWGVPHDPVHDPHRVNSGGTLGGHVEGVPKPFLSAPTNCHSGPLAVNFKSRSWEHPEDWLEESSPAAEPTGCDQVSFEPSLSARPSTTVADSPSGLEVDLKVPQNENCDFIPESQQEEEEMLENVESLYDCALSTSHLKDATVRLPEGLAINPASANGLDGCSSSEAGLTTPLGQIPAQFNGKPTNCPDASRIGSVEVDTPLLDNPMQGSVFLADPYDNPYQSFLGLYIAVDDAKTGIVATIPGKVETDPDTGQLTATFQDNPQLPFEHFLIHFKQGPHAPLRTPAACGTYATTGVLSGYANPDSPVATNDEWQITQGPGGTCASAAAALPNAPKLDAGTVSPSAGSYSPFVMHLRREDGTQAFKSVTVSPPAGLVAKLAGVAQCPASALAAAAAKSGRQEQANPSCPAASRIGTVIAGAGAGPSPYYANGTAYLTGPYKGAPLSLAIITPATAGPFDLGTIVVRTALHLDPVTAKITAVSDEIPSILKGIPLDVRTVDLSLDRSQFTQTGTSCDPSSVDAALTSTLGQVASISSRFQLAECSSLGFKPKLALHLKGGTTRGKHPALTAILTPRPGDANIAAISVALPKSEFLDQSHIGTVCTRVQFKADQCPAASIYGKATVTTPLFDFPLTGNVYLRSSDNQLPDLVPDLRGPVQMPIQVEAAGRTDSVNGGLRNSFDYVPDAPFTKLVMQLRGGKKGLLQNSRNICASTSRATVKYSAHNGKVREGHPELEASCGAKRKGKRGAHHKHGAAKRSALR
jgi:hypothetical protein